MKIIDRIGVCSWSLQPDSPEILVQKLEQSGIRKVQIALDPVRENPRVWARLKDVSQACGIEIVSGMFGCVGEDYSTLESIKKTGGIVPDHTWEQNWKNIQETIRIAKDFGLKLVTFHAGFIPHDKKDPSFEKLSGRLRKIADAFGEARIALGLETGQETAETLRSLLETLGAKNVVVNFDPANIILYDKGDPVKSLKTLYPWVRQCHLKDATRTKVPGTWGEEVRLGTGEVDWRAFFTVLIENEFTGNLCIEREAGTQRMADITAAFQYVKNLFNE
ncbi:MAG: sugar phosphate isomerase/epimerase [Verrucomicrobiae bacterium]|nr:sugar phosphate isomerase/epimerase [Verrucomicrobiae bacterium]